MNEATDINDKWHVCEECGRIYQDCCVNTILKIHPCDVYSGHIPYSSDDTSTWKEEIGTGRECNTCYVELFACCIVGVGNYTYDC